jgi:hypothetical protein
MREMSIVRTLAIVFSFVYAANCWAATTAYSTNVQTGNQVWEGSLGLDFNVLNEPIDILQLGVFDSDGDGLNRPITVGIFDRITQALVTPTLLFSGNVGTLVDGYRFNPLASVVSLAPGQYSIVAWGYGPGEANGNVGCNNSVSGTCLGNVVTAPTPNSAGGAIEFVGGGRYSGPAGAYPDQLDGGPASRYLAGNFIYSSVPEPGTAVLFAFGFAGVAAWARRKRLQQGWDT